MWNGFEQKYENHCPTSASMPAKCELLHKHRSWQLPGHFSSLNWHEIHAKLYYTMTVTSLACEMIYRTQWCSPQVSVQPNRVPAEDGAQNDIHLLHRFRIADEDPKFLMIYYDNDQFCGEDIYYLQNASFQNQVHQLVLHFFGCAINQRGQATHLNLMHSNNSALIRTINHLYAMALEFYEGKWSNTRWCLACLVSAAAAPASMRLAVELISYHHRHRLATSHCRDALKDKLMMIYCILYKKLILNDLWSDVITAK